MSRASDIEELIKSDESDFSQAFITDLHNWLSERGDAEVVEIMRGTAGALAWRMVSESGYHPSEEVFEKALTDVAEFFLESVKREVSEK